MRLVIIGSGDMGGAIAAAFAERTNHQVLVRGSRPGSHSAAALVRELGVTYADDHALLSADVLFVVVPWNSLDAVAEVLDAYRGVLVSVVVPWVDGADLRTGRLSAAEQLAHLLPKARVVNAFTAISSAVVRSPGNGEKPSVLACSDDDEARTMVVDLIREIGLDPVNGGRLTCARYAEGMGLLLISLAYEAGYGNRVAFRVYVAKQE
jgi:8-hydroxy-5-deazaflavin:NADPH oxidoreductase